MPAWSFSFDNVDLLFFTGLILVSGWTIIIAGEPFLLGPGFIESRMAMPVRLLLVVARLPIMVLHAVITAPFTVWRGPAQFDSFHEKAEFYRMRRSPLLFAKATVMCICDNFIVFVVEEVDFILAPRR